MHVPPREYLLLLFLTMIPLQIYNGLWYFALADLRMKEVGWRKEKGETDWINVNYYLSEKSHIVGFFPSLTSRINNDTIMTCFMLCFCVKLDQAENILLKL